MRWSCDKIELLACSVTPGSGEALINRQIKHDVTSNGKNETFAVCLQPSVQYSENVCICGEK